MTTSTMSSQIANQLKNGEVIQITAERFPKTAVTTCATFFVSETITLEQATALVAASIAGIARMMGTANAELQAAEAGYAAEQADDPPVRKKRDDANADLARRWADVKSGLSRSFGDEAIREYGLEGDMPKTPDRLALQTANAMRLLRAKARSFENKVGSFSTKGAADHLEEAQTGLAESLTEVINEVKELQDALGIREAEVVEWTNVYQSSATLLEGYLRLGGRIDLADRVRPTVRRASGLDPAPEAPVDADTLTDGGSPEVPAPPTEPVVTP